jgi:hypothetical protein
MQPLGVQIQKEVISDLKRETHGFCQKRYGSLYDWSLERHLSTDFFKLDFTAHCIMEFFSEFGLGSDLKKEVEKKS